MAVSYVGKGGTGNTLQSGSTSVVVTGVATSPQVGDLLLMWVFHKGTLVSAPSGWTAGPLNSLGQAGATDGSNSVTWFYKWVTSSGTQADVTISGLTNSSVGSMACFRGVNPTTPFKAVTGNSYAAKYAVHAEAEGAGMAASDNGAIGIVAAVGDCAIGICAISNDDTISWSYIYADQGGSTFPSLVEIAQGLNTAGTDSSGGWFYGINTGTSRSADGFTAAATEQSSGTSTAYDGLFVLNGAAASVQMEGARATTVTITAGAIQTFVAGAASAITATLAAGLSQTATVQATTLAATATFGAAVTRTQPIDTTGVSATATISAGAVASKALDTSLPVTATITSGALREARVGATSLAATATITSGAQQTLAAGTSLPVTATITSAALREAIVGTSLPVTATITSELTVTAGGTTQTIDAALPITATLSTGALREAIVGASLAVTTTISSVLFLAANIGAPLSATVTIASGMTVTPPAAEVARRAVTTGQINSGGISCTVTASASAQVGDVMLMFTGDGAGPHTGVTITGGANGTWNHASTFPNGLTGTYTGVDLWWKVVEAADIGATFTQSWTETGQKAVIILAIYSGVDTTAPFHQVQSGYQGTASLNTATASVTTTETGWALAFYTSRDSSVITTFTASTGPSNELADIGTTGSSSVSGALYDTNSGIQAGTLQGTGTQSQSVRYSTAILALHGSVSGGQQEGGATLDITASITASIPGAVEIATSLAITATLSTAANIPGAAHNRLILVGDIQPKADSSATRAIHTADHAELESNIDYIISAGDFTDSGLAADYVTFQDPAWGRSALKSRIRNANGNHDAEKTTNGVDYWNYFSNNNNTGAQGTWYWSFDVGNWHVIMLDSRVNSMASGSTQYNWLDADLAAHDMPTIVCWHNPIWCRGNYAPIDSSSSADVWDLLYGTYKDRVEIVLNGDNHTYERWPRVQRNAADNGNPTTVSDGIRSWIVSTGGATIYTVDLSYTADPEAYSSATDTRGYLVLDLYDDRYEWNYVTVEGTTINDSGSQSLKTPVSADVEIAGTLSVTATFGAEATRTALVDTNALDVSATIFSTPQSIVSVGTEVAVTATVDTGMESIKSIDVSALVVMATLETAVTYIVVSETTLSVTASLSTAAVGTLFIENLFTITFAVGTEIVRTAVTETALDVSVTVSTEADITGAVTVAANTVAVTVTLVSAVTYTVLVEANTLAITATTVSELTRTGFLEVNALAVTATLTVIAAGLQVIGGTLVITSTITVEMLRTAFMTNNLEILGTVTVEAAEVFEATVIALDAIASISTGVYRETFAQVTELAITSTIVSGVTSGKVIGATLNLSASIVSTMQLTVAVVTLLDIAVTITDLLVRTQQVAATLPITATFIATAFAGVRVSSKVWVKNLTTGAFMQADVWARDANDVFIESLVFVRSGYGQPFVQVLDT